MKKIKIILGISIVAILFSLVLSRGISAEFSAQEKNSTDIMTEQALSIIVCLDPGHGGTATGAVNNGLTEKEINLDVAQRIRNLLLATSEYSVVMTRTDNDTTLSNRDRYTFCNKEGADIMISNHINSYSDPIVNGTESYYFHEDDKILAGYAQTAMVNYLETRNRGIKKAAFGVLLKSKMPAALLEPVFMSNSNEAEKLVIVCEDGGDCRRQEIAQSIFNGIKNYVADGMPQPEEPGNGGHGKPDKHGKGKN